MNRKKSRRRNFQDKRVTQECFRHMQQKKVDSSGWQNETPALLGGSVGQ